MSAIDFSGFNFADDNNVNKGIFSKINVAQIIEKAIKFDLEKTKKLEEENTKKRDIINVLSEWHTHLSDIKSFLNSSDGINSVINKKIVIVDKPEYLTAKFIGNDNQFIDGIKIQVKKMASYPIFVSYIVKDGIEMKIEDWLNSLDNTGNTIPKLPLELKIPTNIEKKKANVIIGNEGINYHTFEVDESSKIIDYINFINEKSTLIKAYFFFVDDNKSGRIIVKYVDPGSSVARSLFISSNNSTVPDWMLEKNFSLSNSQIVILPGETNINNISNINDYTINSHDNKFTISDSLEVNVLKESGNEFIELSIINDKDATLKSLNQFINLYNNLQDFLITNKKRNDTKSSNDIILGELSIFRIFQSKFQNLIGKKYDNKSLYDIGFIEENNGHLKLKYNFISSLESNKIAINDFLDELVKNISTFTDYSGLIKEEIENHVKSIESISKNIIEINKRIKDKKQNLAKKMYTLEGKIIESEQLIKMIEMYQKQLAK